MTRTVRSCVTDGLADVVIDDPARRNALSPATLRELIRVFGELGADPSVRVLTLRGAGADFSAGVALDQAVDALFAPGEGDLLSAACRALAAVPVPTLSLVRGVCMGGAWALAASADLMPAADDARIAITPARLGLMLPELGVRLLAEHVGPDRARYLLLSGDEVGIARAEAWGLVTMVFPADGFEAEAAALAERLRERSDYTQAAVGALLGGAAAEGAGRDAAEGAAEYARFWDALPSSEDLAIGKSAFARKEKPRFTWRRS